MRTVRKIRRYIKIISLAVKTADAYKTAEKVRKIAVDLQNRQRQKKEGGSNEAQ